MKLSKEEFEELKSIIWKKYNNLLVQRNNIENIMKKIPKDDFVMQEYNEIQQEKNLLFNLYIKIEKEYKGE